MCKYNNKLMNELQIISSKLKSINKKVYIVWWYTREKILNWTYLWDIDLATDATPFEMKELLHVIKGVWKKYWTLIIKEWWQVFEITTFRKDIWILDNRKPVEVIFTDNLIEDSQRRDFSCNAIYYDIMNNSYIDPQNWISDIKNNVIKFIWEPFDRIQEDTLRILRFIRFKNKYNFDLYDKNYLNILKENINLLKNISIERIKEELDKILLLENNIQALKDLKEIWFFKIFIPLIDKLEQTEWWLKYHLEWNVWKHTLMTILELNDIFLNWCKWLMINYTKTEKIDLYRTLLLHDIWKVETFSRDANWYVHYYNHENVSYEYSKNILKEFKFSKKSTQKILWIIKNHLRIFKIMEMRILKSRKFMLNKYFYDLMIVWICDHKWRIPSDDILVYKLIKFYNNFQEILKSKKFLSWNDILDKYPDLKWIDIKNKLNSLNDDILIKD